MCFSSLSYSQNFSLAIETGNQIAYIGLDNKISCTVEGTACHSINLATLNGSIKKISSCLYVYRPLKISNSKIIITKKVNNKTIKIGEYFIYVRNFPDPIATVGGLNGGLISKKKLNAQQGVGAMAPSYLGFDLKYQVKNFVITAIRNKEILFFKYVEGNLFTSEIHILFDTLQQGDIITFSLINVLKADGREGRANVIEFTIE